VKVAKQPFDKATYEAPRLSHVLSEAALYTEVHLRLKPREFGRDEESALPRDMPHVASLLFPSFALDCFCPLCRQHSIFKAPTTNAATKAELDTKLTEGRTISNGRQNRLAQ
jgi:hypothetical protein